MVSGDLRRQAGLTLIELVVVLTLIGLLAALAGPAMRPLLPAASDGNELIRALEVARSDAARSGRPVELWIDMRTGRVGELTAGAEDEWLALRSGPTENGPASEKRNWRRVVFDPTGRSTGGRLEFFTGSRRAFTLSIDHWSGRVRTTRGE